ncbi:MarR family winged helix-turn-helix transcriptional regulator [Gordonibacter sp. An230]|uniref:MarR family winged helix-turn-helix transcriptional regulator n=1 Tax=Gordonibacter sp. An230 TaxID=1965592 RepID=UPI001EF44755|nr:MarR family transcriptional regulator [Gordonibacter sp. An230]
MSDWLGSRGRFFRFFLASSMAYLFIDNEDISNNQAILLINEYTRIIEYSILASRIVMLACNDLRGKESRMNESTKTLAQLKKASKLVRLAFRKNGPKSFKRGQGALLNALVENDGATQRELVRILGLNRGDLKDVVKKAARNGYVTIENTDEKRTYAVKLTDEGRTVAEKRVLANDRTADDILSCLTDDEIAQLNVLTEKIILSMKDKGVNGKKKGRKARGCRCR